MAVDIQDGKITVRNIKIRLTPSAAPRWPCPAKPVEQVEPTTDYIGEVRSIASLEQAQ